MLKIINRELCIFISTLFFCYIAHKFDSYNVMIIYLLVRMFVEKKFED